MVTLIEPSDKNLTLNRFYTIYPRVITIYPISDVFSVRLASMDYWK